MRLSDCWYMSFTPNGGACRNPWEDEVSQKGGIFNRICAAALPLLLNAPVSLIAQGWIPQSYCKAIFPLHQAMAVALESSHIYSEITEKNQTSGFLVGARLASSCGIMVLTLWHLPLGLMAMTARDLSLETGRFVYQWKQGDLGKVIESVQKIALYTLYLCCAHLPTVLSLGILYAGVQGVSSACHGIIELWKGRQGDWIALAGHMALAVQQGQRAQNLQVAQNIVANMNKFYARIRAVPAFANS